MVRLLPDVEGRLRSYVDLLERFAPTLGLLGPSEASALWERHILDSLRALPCLMESEAVLVDLGSGGGLPGIPVAIVSPERHVHLLEANQRKAGFLELAAQELALENVTVVSGRAQEVALEADVCLTRAFAPPAETWKVARMLLNRGGKVLYYAGRSWNQDIQADLERAGAAVAVCQPPRRPGRARSLRFDPVTRKEWQVMRHR